VINQCQLALAYTPANAGLVILGSYCVVHGLSVAHTQRYASRCASN